VTEICSQPGEINSLRVGRRDDDAGDLISHIPSRPARRIEPKLRLFRFVVDLLYDKCTTSRKSSLQILYRFYLTNPYQVENL